MTSNRQSSWFHGDRFDGLWIVQTSQEDSLDAPWHFPRDFSDYHVKNLWSDTLGVRTRFYCFSSQNHFDWKNNRIAPVSSCCDGLRYMVSITLNSALFSKISNVHIFRTMHRIVMIFSSKFTLQVNWQMLSTFGTVEYSTGPMRTPKGSTS